MIRRYLVWAFAAMLLPLMQAWGGGTTYYYAALKAAVASGSTGMGKVYAGTSTSAGTYRETESTSDTQSVTSSTATDKTFYAFAEANDGYEFVNWTAGTGATIDDAAKNPATVTVQTSTTGSGTRTGVVYANFRKQALAAFAITFASATGSYTVDGAPPEDKTGLTEITSFTLASADENFYSWTINGAEVFDNPYTGSAKSTTAVGATFLTSDQCATAATYEELNVAMANDTIKQVTIASGTEIRVAAGQTLSVGKKLVVDGKLIVLGTVNNTGVISGSGQVLKIVKNIAQSDPIKPQNSYTNYTSFAFSNYGTYSCIYCTTTVTSISPSVTGTVTCPTSWGVLLNGTTAFAIGAQDPYALNVTVGAGAVGKPINQITGITGCQTSKSYTGDSGTFLMLKDWEINNKTFQGLVDCGGGNKLNYPSADDYHKRLMVVNGQVDHGSGQFKNGTIACFNCTYCRVKSLWNSPLFYFFDCGTASSPATVEFTYENSNGSGSYSDACAKTTKSSYFYSGYINYTFTANNDKDVAKSYVYGGSFSTDPTDKAIIEPGYEIDSCSGRYELIVAKPKPYVVNIGSQGYVSLQAAVDAAGVGARLELIQALELDGSLTIASDKQLTIDLGGFDLSGGSIVNEGKLRFEDTSASSTKGTLSVPVTNNGNGTIDITYGDYSGTFTLNGGTLTTHNGTFASTFSVVENGGTWSVRGGKYSCPVAIPDGYRTYENGYLGEIVKGLISPNNPISSNYADFSYTIKGLEDARSLSLYQQYRHGAVAREKYEDADWDRIAELCACVGYLERKYIEAAVVFDREVKQGTFRGVVKMSGNVKSMAFDHDVQAGEECRMLLPMILSNGYTPKGYDFMFNGGEEGVWETLYCGGRNDSLDNVGTTVTLKFQVRTQERSADYTTENQHHDYLPYADLAVYPHKITGKGAIFGSTDYTSLSGALSAAGYSGVVKLSKDCAEEIVVSQKTTFTLDRNSFAFTGSVKAGENFKVTEEDLGDGKTAYAFVRAVPESCALSVPTAEHSSVEYVTANDVELKAVDGVYTVPYGHSLYMRYRAEPGYALSRYVVSMASVTNETLVLEAPVVTVAQYALTYVLNGGTMAEENPASYTKFDETIVLEDPAREHFSFRGRYPDSNGWGEWVTSITNGSEGVRTFYAKRNHTFVTFAVPEVEHMTARVSVSDGEAARDGANCTVWSGVRVTVTYEAESGYGPASVTRVIDVAADGLSLDVSDVSATRAEYQIVVNYYDGEPGGDCPASYTVDSDDITVPAPTRTGYDFGGWYEDAGFSKMCGAVTIPHGSTGDRTLHASWLTAKTVEAATTSGETKDVEVDVPEGWVENAVGKDATPDEVKEALQTTAANGLQTWQNFALDAAGVTTNQTVSVPTEDASKPAEVEVRVTTNAKVKSVGVARISETDGVKTVEEKVVTTVVTEGEEAKVTIDYASQPAGIYQPTVVIESKNGVEVEIPDPNATAVQVVKNDEQKTKTVLPVPFSTALDGESVKVSSVVNTSSLAAGDTIKVYNRTKDAYDTWEYKGDTTWSKVVNVDVATSTMDEPEQEATEMVVPAGSAIILERGEASKTNEITLVGVYDSNAAVETPIMPAVEKQEGEVTKTWNLVANAKTDGGDFEFKDIDNASTNDQIIVVSEVAGVEPRRYSREADGTWSYTTNAVTEVNHPKLGKVKVSRAEKVTGDSKVKSGSWFWYLSGQKGADTRIDWKK